MQTQNASTAFRTNLAQLVSPLRRVRPRIPFYNLPAHRVPTLWSLYRGLLREASSEHIAFRIRMLFRVNQHRTGTERTKRILEMGYRWLDIFRRANREDDRKLQAILVRYSSMIAAKRRKEYWKELGLKELAWQHRLRTRPILTGGLVLASMFNKPFPRMKPQPHDISRIISKRIKSKENRFGRWQRLQSDLEDVTHEVKFEQGLVGRDAAATERKGGGGGGVEPRFGGSLDEWRAPIIDAVREIHASLRLQVARSNLQPSPELLKTTKAARHERILNKTRERERERRGEVLRSTLRRARKAPPAHVLARMTEEEKRMDRVVRNVSEVGYVAQVKRRLGFKLRDPEAWKKENQ